MHPVAFARSAGPLSVRPHRSSSCAILNEPKNVLSAGPQSTRPQRRSSCPDLLEAHQSSGEEQGSAASNRSDAGIDLPTLKQAAVFFAVLAMAFWPAELPFEKSLQLNQHQASAAQQPQARVNPRPVVAELPKKAQHPPVPENPFLGTQACGLACVRLRDGERDTRFCYSSTPVSKKPNGNGLAWS